MSYTGYADAYSGGGATVNPPLINQAAHAISGTVAGGTLAVRPPRISQTQMFTGSVTTFGTGWGNGEWTDMPWNGGAYVYDPTIFFDAEGPYIPTRTRTGRLLLFASTGPMPSRTATGRLVSAVSASGSRRSYSASGLSRSYTATGVLEHDD